MKLFDKGHYRWKIATLLCLASALNYIDRNTLAILAPTIQKELHWTDADYANITALFVLSYTIMYALSGRFIDWIGTRKGMGISVGAWSLVTILNAFATTIGQFSVARFFLGITESGNFPAGVKSASEWFPMKERALAIGIFSSGSSIGAALAVPIVSFIAVLWDWRIAFVVTGLLGFIWLIFWLKCYHLPASHPKLSEEEKKFILEDQNDLSSSEKEPPSFSVKTLLMKKESWGCFSARILIDPVVYFLMFWIPKYLHDIHGLSLAKIGMTAWLPYAAMGAGAILGGWLPKYLIERNQWTLNKSRKTIMLISSLAVPICCYFLSGSVGSISAILLISGIMMAHGLWSNITLPTEIYPVSVQASITGIGGTLGGLMGVVSQKLVGISVENHSYLPVFIYMGAAYLVSFLLVHFLIGKLGYVRNF